MHMPIARNTLRLSRAATSGSPRNNSVMSRKRLQDPRVDHHPHVGAEIDALVLQGQDQLAGRGEPPHHGAAGQLVNRYVGDHKGLVGLEPVGMVVRRQENGPAVQGKRGARGQVLRLAYVDQQIARRPAVSAPA